MAKINGEFTGKPSLIREIKRKNQNKSEQKETLNILSESPW